MTACIDSCQHPACWKAEFDIRRKILQNEPVDYFSNDENESGGKLRYDARNECIVEVAGSLATYKTLDLLKNGFPPYGKPYEENYSILHLPKISDERQDLERNKENDCQNLSFHSDVNKPLITYLRKLCIRPKDVERRENVLSKESSIKKPITKTMTFDNLHCAENEYHKIFTWVPGRKSKSSVVEGREPRIALKVIDGTDVPNDYLLSDVYTGHRFRAQQTSHSIPRRTTPHRFPLDGVDHNDYIQLFRHTDFARKRDQVSMNKLDVKIPSPLQTNRLRLNEVCNESKTAIQTKHVKIQPDTSTDKNIENDRITPFEKNNVKCEKSIYIRNGIVLPTSPDLENPISTKSSMRTPLQLTCVSVTKETVKQLPLFDHCSSSIKKTDLPHVTMQPLTSGVNTSAVSLDNSSNLQMPCDNNLPFSASPILDMAIVPASSPVQMNNISPQPLDINNATPNENISDFDKQLREITMSVMEPHQTLLGDDMDSIHDILKPVNFLERSDIEMEISKFSEKKCSNDDSKLQPATIISPSTIMISKATKSETMLNHAEISVENRQSPTLSLGSKTSLEGWLIDKDIITRTYDKYQTFTPFETPLNSVRVNSIDISEKTKQMTDSCKLSSKQQILPPSIHIHNLDLLLPGEDVSLTPNTSFLGSCLSPSRSMFVQQHKQPPIKTVPSEIIVSRFPLLPAIAKSHTKSQKRKQNKNNIGLNDNHSYVEQIPPSNQSAHNFITIDSSNVSVSNFDHGYEDYVEEVLLMKESFSAFDFLHMNDNLQQSIKKGKEGDILLEPNQHGSNLQRNDHGSVDILQPSQHGSTIHVGDLSCGTYFSNDDRKQIPNTKEADTYHNSIIIGKPVYSFHEDNTIEKPVDSSWEDNTTEKPVDSSCKDKIVIKTENKRNNFDCKLKSVSPIFNKYRMPNSFPTSDIQSGTANDVMSCKSVFNAGEIGGENSSQEDAITEKSVNSSYEDSIVITKSGSKKKSTSPISNNYVVPNSPLFTEHTSSQIDVMPGKSVFNAGKIGREDLCPEDNTAEKLEDNIVVIKSESRGSAFDNKLKPVMPISNNYTTSNSSITGDIHSSHAEIDSISCKYLFNAGEIGKEDSEKMTEFYQSDYNLTAFIKHSGSQESNLLEVNQPLLCVNENSNEDADVKIMEDTDTNVNNTTMVIGDTGNTEVNNGATRIIEEKELIHIKSNYIANENVVLPEKILSSSMENKSFLDYDENSGKSLHEKGVLKSVMKDIFTSQLSQTSSLSSVCVEDFSEGLDLDLGLEEEIVRAMNGLEEFVLDNYEVDMA